MDTKKVVLIGTGFVGMSMAYSFLNQGGIDELVLIDVDKDKTVGEEMDLNHGLPYAPEKIKIRSGEYYDCKDADVVVITAGLAQKPGQTRLDLTLENAKIMKTITENVMESGFNGIFVIASNPVDTMSYVVYKTSGLDKSKVIGSGTILDTARLKQLLAEYFEVSSKSIHAYILGEHGDSSLVPWEHCYIGCKKLMEYAEEKGYSEEEIKAIHDAVWQAAYEIIAKKKATYYGIAMSVRRLCQAIMRNENSILPVSVPMHGEYGINDVVLSFPSIVGKNGVESRMPIELSLEEQEALRESAETLKSVLNKIEL